MQGTHWMITALRHLNPRGRCCLVCGVLVYLLHHPQMDEKLSLSYDHIQIRLNNNNNNNINKNNNNYYHNNNNYNNNNN